MNISHSIHFDISFLPEQNKTKIEATYVDVTGNVYKFFEILPPNVPSYSVIGKIAKRMFKDAGKYLTEKYNND